MKLSEMNSRDLCNALCVLADPIGEISNDDEVAEALKRMAEHKSSKTVMGRLIGVAYADFVPLLLKKHKAATFQVLSVLTGKTMEEIEQENGFQLLQDVRSIWNAELLRFFGSSVDTELTE